MNVLRGRRKDINDLSNIANIYYEEIKYAKEQAIEIDKRVKS